MYSRSKDRPNYPVRLPKHYSGWAFSEQEVSDTPPCTEHLPSPPSPPPSPPSPPSPPPSRPTPPVALTPTAPHPNEKEPPSFLQPFRGLFGNIGNSFPFTHGLGFDEILILGLILLLAHNEEDPDILLLLGLLLFCG